MARGKDPNRSDGTLCVHAGEERHGTNEPLATPIAQTSAFVLPSLEEMQRIAQGQSRAFLYSRYANPTVRVAEQKIAALEGAEDCVITSSGMAAVLVAVLTACSAGDEIVSMLDVYGGTVKLLEEVVSRLGIRTKFVPYKELGHIERHMTRHSRLLLLESPTNPTLRCVDLAGLATKAHRRRIFVLVDNTFATPTLQKPLQFGADAVLHSATKYLGGHSDLTAGALAGNQDWIARARRAMLLCGASLDPAAAYLLIRGLKTLELRVERACQNAAILAEELRQHPRVARVLYPGFAENEGYEFAQHQMRAPGMMVSFELKGGRRSAEKLIDRLKLWYLAATLGGVESTVSYPILSSHVGLDSKRLKLLDVSPATVRLSVGIENAADLVADLNQALAGA